MATSYTTYFNLGKPADGDLNWGPVVNSNTDVIDVGLQAAKNASNLTSGTVPSARMPVATDSALGAVKGFTNLTISGQGLLSLSGSNVTDALGYTPVNPSSRGVANGYASLDSNGLVPSAQLSISTSQVTEGTKLFFTTQRAADAAPVQSVAGKTGSVTLSSDDLTEGSNLFYTSARFDNRLATKTTDNLTEGSTNVYFTASRFNTQLATKTTSDLAEGSNLYYTAGRFDSRLAVKTTDNLTEGLSNLYFTTGRVDSHLATKTTSDIAEGSNLYYTTTRFDTRFDTRLGTKTTDNLAEGSTNLYFTTARVDSQFATKTTSDLGEGSNLYYTAARFDTRFGTKTTDNLTEGSTNLYWSAGKFNTAFSGKTTSDLGEGSNLYYTTARFDTRLASKTTDNLTEGSTNLYWSSGKFDTAFSGKTTSDLGEGSNLYYTAGRVNSRIEAHSRAFKGIANGLGNVQFSASAYDDTLKVAAGTGVDVAFDSDAKKITVSNSGVTSVNGQTGDVTVVSSLAKRSFAQLNVVGGLDAHAESGGVNDFYMNTDGAKTLRKIIVSSPATPASGTIVVDLKLVTAQGGSATSLFPTKTKPTVTCADGAAWVLLTGSSLDTVAIPDNCMIQVTIVSAPAGSSDLRVELFE